MTAGRFVSVMKNLPPSFGASRGICQPVAGVLRRWKKCASSSNPKKIRCVREIKRHMICNIAKLISN
jgi:hypothetical protein